LVSRSAIGRLINVCAELRKSVLSGSRALATPGAHFDDGVAFGINGVCRFELDTEYGELRFQFAGREPDAVVASPDGAFVRKSDPYRQVDPLGLLRGLLLECAMRSSRPPPPDDTR
jgi:hypothetical protein